MTCAEAEILLCDYVDGTLYGESKSALEAHLAACRICAEVHRDITGAIGFMERAAGAEPPADLLTRILHQIPAGRHSARWRRVWGGRLEAILQPRYAMGITMTVLSFSMLARFTGINPRQLRAEDLNPVKVWMAVDDRAHRTWDRAMKSYENLRWVIEIQSRLKEWSEQDQQAPVAPPTDEKKTEPKQ